MDRSLGIAKSGAQKLPSNAGLIFSILFLHSGSNLAQANTILTFDDLNEAVEVGDCYNGGTSSDGNPGPNCAIAFKSGAIVRRLSIGNVPAPATSAAVAFVDGRNQWVNVYNGFTSFSFQYSAPVATSAYVQIWSGIFGSGTVLGTSEIEGATGTNCVASVPFSCWSSGTVSFSGVAQAVSFNGVENLAIYFTDLDFGTPSVSQPPPSAVPEPAT